MLELEGFHRIGVVIISAYPSWILLPPL